MNVPQKQNFFSFALEDLAKWLAEYQFPKYSLRQIVDWVYRKDVWDPDEWSNLSKKLRGLMKEQVYFKLPEIVYSKKSLDGTRKYLLKFDDGLVIESVLILSLSGRKTLCLSTQVGCAIGCRFCHTATQGLKRNLTVDEIVGQYLVIQKDFFQNKKEDEKRITNIVYMGQGEPLDNFENVKKATELFVEPTGIALGTRKITLSTSGLIPEIERLNEFPNINLAISLHASSDLVRNQIMPINKKYNLKNLFQSLDKFSERTGKKITYEYLLIDGVNNKRSDIVGLTELLDRKLSKINLIPFNDFPGSNYKRPSESNVKWFAHQLLQKGFTCTIRTTKGDDILAACGQLKSLYKSKKLPKSNVTAPIESKPLKSPSIF